MIFTKILMISLITLFIISCGKGKYESMTYKELKDKERHCDSIPKKTAVFANGCESVKKEIKRRRELRKKK